MIHRNVSGDTIWLTESSHNANAMLAGFEFSQMCVPRQRLSASLGQVQYMAPEVFKKDYSFAADSHSLGVLVYTLLTGDLPFEGDNGKGAVLNTCCYAAFGGEFTCLRPVDSLG